MFKINSKGIRSLQSAGTARYTETAVYTKILDDRKCPNSNPAEKKLNSPTMMPEDFQKRINSANSFGHFF
jgi:hypothetical protein